MSLVEGRPAEQNASLTGSLRRRSSCSAWPNRVFEQRILSHVRGTVASHIFPPEWRNSPVTEAQENPAALDGVRDGLLDLIYGIGRRNRLANAAGPDHLDQLA